jgi:predicted RNase H-like HicB family nuclease
MSEITFLVTRDDVDGGYCAVWEDPAGGGISTQGDDLAELEQMVCDAVEGYFEVKKISPPQSVRLHFAADPILELTR